MRSLLYIITNFENGAVPSILLDLAPEIEKGNFKPKFLAIEELNEEHESVKRCRAAGYSLESLNCRPRDTIKSIFALRSYLRKNKPDLVHTHLGRADVFTAWAKPKTLPMISTFHSVKRNFNRFTLFGLQATDKIVYCRTGVSQAVIDSFYCDGFLKSRHKAIYNPVWPERLIPGVSVSDMKKDLDIIGKWPVLVNAGRFIEAKGQRFLLEAFPDILKEYPDAVLILAGSGPLEEELRSQASSLKILDHIRWPGFYGRLPDILQLADLVVFPSVWEGLGLVPIESIIMGKPVVASRIPAVEEYLGNQQDWLFNPESAKEISNCVSMALKKIQITKDFQESITKLFNPERIASEYLAIYQKALN